MENLARQYIPVQSFTQRINALFVFIFRYYFTHKPKLSKRTTSFGEYTSLTFHKVAKSPLIQLLKEELISDLSAVEILAKEGSNQSIDDTDLEAILLSAREKSDTLFILATKGKVPADDIDRLFRAFTRYQVIILLLGEDDITQLEKFVKDDNINACLIVLLLLTDRITSQGEKVIRHLRYPR